MPVKNRNSEFMRDDLHRFFRKAHWNKLKVDQVLPVGRPLFQQARIFALHQLEAAIEIRLHPAFHVGEAVWVYSLRVGSNADGSEALRR